MKKHPGGTRRWKEREIPATPPDPESQFDYQGRCIQVSFWHGLVSAGTPAAADAGNPQGAFSIYVYEDPFYKQPLVLATNLALAPQSAYLIYRDRWPRPGGTRQAPLAAKQMIGPHCHFVFAPDTCFRLPELGLLAGAILTYVAASLPPTPAGFWDRSLKATPGRLRRVLAQADFPNLAAFDPELRKKNAVTTHLPKGVDAHRRTQRAA